MPNSLSIYLIKQFIFSLKLLVFSLLLKATVVCAVMVLHVLFMILSRLLTPNGRLIRIIIKIAY